MSAVRDYLCDTTMGCRHSILIDPADQTPEVAANRAMAAVHAGSRMVLVGGSSDTDMENVHKTVVAIKEALELVTWASSQDSDAETDLQVPVLLFPQGAAALSPAADGITFMMLMNSTDPRFLIGEQIQGAPLSKKQELSQSLLAMSFVNRGEGRTGRKSRSDWPRRNRPIIRICHGSAVFGLQYVVPRSRQRRRKPCESITNRRC